MLHTILNVDVPKCDARNITNKIQDVSHCTYLNLYHSTEKENHSYYSASYKNIFMCVTSKTGWSLKKIPIHPNTSQQKKCALALPIFLA